VEITIRDMAEDTLERSHQSLLSGFACCLQTGILAKTALFVQNHLKASSSTGFNISILQGQMSREITIVS